MRYVIGSGPAGISCAQALLQRGLEVTMIDAGLNLEADRQAVVQTLGTKPPEQWDPALVQTLKEGFAITSQNVPLKRLYGSDFPYRETEKYLPTKSEGVEIASSLATAGLSNVWGAGLLPCLASDILDWPIGLEDLKPHYEAVLSFMPMSAVQDGLEPLFPLYSKDYHELYPSRQAAELIKDLNLNKDRLDAKGFKFGYSRLAIRSRPGESDPGCVYCGLCMYGCPYGLIYNTSSTLAQLKQEKNFHYIKDVVVQKVVQKPGETEGGVTIVATSRTTQESLRFEASKVYLACGVLPTTKIVLESLGAYNHPLSIQDSQYFLLPFLRYKNTKNVVNEKLHTLAQTFIEVFDPSLGDYPVHFGVYTYNDLYLSFMKKKLGPFYPLLKLPAEEFLGRLLVFQGFLHSNISPTISVQLHRGKGEGHSQLLLSANENPLGRKVIQGTIGKLWKNRSYLKGIPLSPMLRIAEAGRSFHSGGVFPMRANPSEFESDRLGRISGFKDVHVVDATVFPSIPAPTITLTIMANAHRIGSNS